ncbi:hypothetical protein C1H46_038410 [Malus baccata]|uniref:Uncharacterized protein n=1 Tax=Malus baccata TaxID=106549 RepID=A0A540KPE5_MALBA|nr:hypothetical protein C1H46_038410 [Malus baccata]
MNEEKLGIGSRTTAGRCITAGDKATAIDTVIFGCTVFNDLGLLCAFRIICGGKKLTTASEGCAGAIFRAAQPHRAVARLLFLRRRGWRKVSVQPT